MPTKKSKKKYFLTLFILGFLFFIIFLAGIYLGIILYKNNPLIFTKNPSPKITIAELKSKIDNQEGFVLLDLRSPEEYKKEHLPKALMTPYNPLETHSIIEKISPFLDKRDELILYCRGPECKTSEVAARELIGSGFNKVKVLDGDIDNWKKNGWPTEK